MGSRGASSRSSSNNEIVNEFKHYVRVNGENTIKYIAKRVKTDVQETKNKIAQLEKKISSRNTGIKKKETLRKELARQKLYLKNEQARLDAVKELGWL